MLLITETVLDTETHLIEGGDGSKSLFIEGVFAQSEVKNRNGRTYPKEILGREVDRYIREYIETGRAIGELNHPQTSTVNPERASHLIVELKENGNDYVGKAKILNTPLGMVVKGLIDGGVRVGVSTRGVGTVSEGKSGKVVNSDFRLITVDVVTDPSAPSAFVDGIMEGIDGWEGGAIKEQSAEVVKKIIKKTSRRRLESVKMAAFEAFISQL